jgi:ABC-type transport system substrate-binding protein
LGDELTNKLRQLISGGLLAALFSLQPLAALPQVQQVPPLKQVQPVRNVSSAPGASLAPPAKVLRVAQQSISPGPLDPAQINSVYGANIIENMMEPMLQYDYLARPLKLVPLTLREMPEERENGRVYICRLRPGIYFNDDVAFSGKKRELIAADYAYSFRRLFNPRYLSSQFFMVDGKIAGANALREAAGKTGRFDDDTPIAGLQVLDRYTLRITLTEPDLNFLHVLSQQNLAAVAREVVEKYGDDIHRHPVGTGPFRIVEWKQGQRMVLERNPNFHEEHFSADPGSDTVVEPYVREVAALHQGRKLPMLDRVELYWTVESQPLWLAFVSGDLDILNNIPVAYRPGAIPNNQLAPNLQRQQIRLQHYAYPAVWFTSFNMNDPVIGGYTAERIALRRAISLAFDHRASIDIAMYGGGTPAHGVVPPGIAGYDAGFRTDVFTLDLPRARALLDTFGYIDRDGDGWREDPQGLPLKLEVLTQPEPRFIPWDELIIKALTSLGIRSDIKKVHAAENIRLRQAAKFQVSLDAWNMDFPDGEDFYIILAGSSAGFANNSQFALPAFDALFEKSRRLRDSPERNAIYRQMDRLAFAYMPVMTHMFLQRSAVSQPWVSGYVPHTVHIEPWKYLDVVTRGVR